MRLRICIKTPVGQATSMSKKLKPFIFGLWKDQGEALKVNKEDSIIIWKIECDLVKALSIQKRVAMFDQLVAGVFNKKIVQRAIKKFCKLGDDLIVREMLNKQTSVRILKSNEEEGF